MTIDTIPAIVRILLVFALVLLAIKRKWSLGSAFLAGALLLGAAFAMPPGALLLAAGRALVHPKTVSLAAVVALILVFSHTLEKAGQMERLLDGFRGLIRRPKINLVVFPALIGLLPMPGGAIFSAPMVKSLGAEHRLSPAQLSYINYWFRHIWEYWWPLYPGILLTTTLADVNLWRLVLCTAPLTLVALTAGYWPLRGAVGGATSVADRKSPLPFLKEAAPIGCAILLGLTLGMAFSALLPQMLHPIAKELGLLAALLLAIFWVWRRNRMDWGVRWSILKDPALIRMVYMVAAILIFKSILEESRAVERVSQEMLRWNIPLMPIAMILPFLVGGVVGITIAFVGTTFPILISLVHTMGQEAFMLPYLMLALTSGFVGVLVSPLHLCFLLSNEYFKTALVPVYRFMRVPLGALLVAAVGYFWLLRSWMG
ncbi:MAG: DUF401 family protein [Desulfatitalea sp.]|nr:DUF401 family protein [Desulfatitalea sp.]MBI5896887.1 DUF401 family protein [Desulfobacterales bacterium]